MSEADSSDEPAAEVIEFAEALQQASQQARAKQEKASEEASESEAEGAPNLGEGADPGEEEEEGRVAPEQLEGVIESLLFASDKPLSLEDLKALTREEDTRPVAEALETLRARRQGGGVEVAEVAGGYTLRTRAAFAPWVSKLLAGRPVRLSRAMLEAVAIIAYRQPITRPELDDIRGVDCGPVLKTLLDRGLIRIIGKKEEVGRPILYGTTPEFLRVFSLKDLTQLPTLRQFHELSAEHQATLEAKHGPDPGATAPIRSETSAALGGALPGGLPGADAFLDPPAPPLVRVERDPQVTAADADEDAGLLDELESASEAAAEAARPLHPESGEPTSGS
jgi:segregation and condensation protein B